MKNYLIYIIILCAAQLLAQVSIVIDTGDSLVVNGDMEIIVSGDWTNNGVLVAGDGKVKMAGDGTQKISNSNGAFNKLTVDKAAGDVQLESAVAVSDTLRIINGDFDLNGKITDLGMTGYLTETDGNTVKGDSGYISATRDLNMPTNLDIAGLGAQITSSVNQGITEVRRGHAVQSGNNNTGIRRYYDILPTNNSGLNASLTAHYDESELNGLTEAGLSLYTSADAGSNWSHEAGSLDTTNNEITKHNIDSLYRWTAADSAAPLVSIFVLVNAKFFLEGPFASDTMNSYLGDNGLLPLSQPYTVAPWNYTGTENVAAIPANVVDWILVEIRDAADSTAVIDTRAAFLKTDGSVTDLDGSSGIRFDLSTGSYYIALYHRNHLAVMTASSINVTESTAMYDFSTGQAQAFGFQPMADVGNSTFAMRAGDGNADGGVDAIDRNLVWRPDNGSQWTYEKYSDFNLDGGIDAIDRNLYWRVNNGTASQVPQPGNGPSAQPSKGSQTSKTQVAKNTKNISVFEQEQVETNGVAQVTSAKSAVLQARKRAQNIERDETVLEAIKTTDKKNLTKDKRQTAVQKTSAKKDNAGNE